MKPVLVLSFKKWCPLWRWHWRYGLL